MKRLITTISLIILVTGYAVSQNNLRQTFSLGNFEECILLSEELLKKDPKNGQAYFFKGASLVRLEKYYEAEIPLKKSIENGFPTNPANANLLRVYAGINRTEEFFTLLNKVAKNGFTNYAFLNNSKEFDSYRDQTIYKEAYNKIYDNAFPCKSEKETQKLDFWLGNWDIFNPTTGAKVASSIISKSEDGCTLYEDYEHQSGFLGRSMNFYDPRDSLYKQIWVDLRNTVVNYKETESKEGLLTMQADLGNGSLTRTTWIYNKEDDSVLQAAENSNDNGKTWSPGFIGLYKREKSELNQILQARLDEMEALFYENKMVEIANYYTENAQMFEPDGEVYSGNKAIKGYWKTLDGQGISWKLNVIDANEAGDLAYSVVTSNLKYQNNGKEVVAKTRAMLIWKKTLEGYKIHKDFFHYTK